MISEIHYHRHFKRDLERLKRAGWDLEPLRTFMKALFVFPLPKRYGLHKLHGELEGIWDVHIAHDWVVFFRYVDESDVELLRTGTHAMLGMG